MKAALPWLLVGALAAWLAYDTLRGPEPVPDTTGPLVEQVEAAEAARDRALAALEATTKALADSTEAWESERRTIALRAAGARATADSIAQELRAVLDTAGVRMLAEIEAAHAVEVEALSGTIATYETENTALRVGLRTAEFVITAQRHEVEALHALVAEHRSIDRALRDELRKKTRTHRLTLAVAGVGLALAALN